MTTHPISSVPKRALYAMLFVGIVLSVSLLSSPPKANSSSGDNLSGYAWSDTIGWISFNCTDQGSCATSPYGVSIAQSGDMSGYAWSSNIGWVSFNASEVAGCPSGSCQPHFDKTTGKVTGWAKALSVTLGNAGGWDGFISLADVLGSNYGVQVTGCDWGGWAWGDAVVGWVSFSGPGYGVRGTGDACKSVVVTNPDLVSGTISVPTLSKSGTVLNLSGVVRNNSTVPILTDFSDDFTYQWGGTNPSGWNAFAGNTVLHSGGIGAGESLIDTGVTLFLARGTTGDLYIQHCVDSARQINEGSAETPNCSISSPIRVTNDVEGTLNVSSLNVNSGETVRFSWTTQNVSGPGSGCTVQGGQSDFWTGTSNRGVVSEVLTASSNIYTLSCTDGISPAKVVDVVNIVVQTINQAQTNTNQAQGTGPSQTNTNQAQGTGPSQTNTNQTQLNNSLQTTDPLLTISPRFVTSSNEKIEINWDLQLHTGCKLSGGNLTPQSIFGNGRVSNVTIDGRTTFTISCTSGATVSRTVEIQTKGFES